MAFSASDLDILCGATAAPPPTPSAQPPNHHSSTAASPTADALSRLLHRLPPSLSLPSRLKPNRPLPPPTLNFSSQNTPNDHLLNYLFNGQLGLFQLTHHGLPSQLAESAELDSLALFSLPREDKNRFSSSKTWPLGFDDGEGESVCLDESCFAESTQLPLMSLGELARELEKLGLRIAEGLLVGCERDQRVMSSLMWVSSCPESEREYPYIVSLEYQIRRREYSVLAESGWVSVCPEVDSVLVTIGDIAHVWSNGKLKKVRSKRVVEDGSTPCLTMSLLITLPTESTVSVAPLPPRKPVQTDQDGLNDATEAEEQEIIQVFNPFSFEDYAWRVYHERFLSKDPLDRYRRR